MTCSSVLRRLVVTGALLIGLAGLASAQTTPPSTTTPPPAAATPATPAPAPAPSSPPAPAAPAPAAAAPAPNAPAATAPSPAQATPAPSVPPAATLPDATGGDTSISQTLTLQPHPVIELSGKSSWDDGFKTLNDSFDKLNAALAKAGVKPTGNPMAVFTETDDAGFKFTAEVPVEKAPDPKPSDLPADISFGESPSGKVMKFQHRSAYDDIDSTYEAITAYLDEKGLEAKNMFAEEYLNRVKTSDDNALEVDIYVFLK